MKEIDWLINHMGLLSEEELAECNQYNLFERIQMFKRHDENANITECLPLIHRLHNKYELVQYFVVNKELIMSPGKIAAQVAHVATIVAEYCLNPENAHDKNVQYFLRWFNWDQKKIVLGGKEKDLEKLMEQGWFHIRDLGLTEIPENSLTCVGFYPVPKYQIQPVIKRFRLL